MEYKLFETINKLKEINNDPTVKYQTELVDGIDVMNNTQSCYHIKTCKIDLNVTPIQDFNFELIQSDLPYNVQDLRKKWNKLSKNLKIQVALIFVDKLSLYLHSEQTIQLRYVLISSIAQKKIRLLSDVKYNSEQGYLEKVYKLKYENHHFYFEDKPNQIGVGLDTFLK